MSVCFLSSLRSDLAHTSCSLQSTGLHHFDLSISFVSNGRRITVFLTSFRRSTPSQSSTSVSAWVSPMSTSSITRPTLFSSTLRRSWVTQSLEFPLVRIFLLSLSRSAVLIKLTTQQQNTGGHEHNCGFCGFGCTSSEKQGGVITFLRDAAERGAKFFIETSVERLLFAATPSTSLPTTVQDLDKYTPTSSRKHCIGALIKDKNGTLALIRARQAVVVSAGTIHSPAVLMRSGLKNSRIGQNLRLHPVAVSFSPTRSLSPFDLTLLRDL